MKRIIFFIVGLITVMAASAQVYYDPPYAVYQPITPTTPNYGSKSAAPDVPDIFNSVPMNTQNTQKAKPQYVRITGYYWKNDAWHRITMRINPITKPYIGEQIWLREYLRDNYWQKCNYQASSTEYDSDYIKENFNWKVSLMPYGTIYFSY